MGVRKSSTAFVGKNPERGPSLRPHWSFHKPGKVASFFSVGENPERVPSLRPRWCFHKRGKEAPFSSSGDNTKKCAHYCLVICYKD